MESTKGNKIDSKTEKVKESTECQVLILLFLYFFVTNSYAKKKLEDFCHKKIKKLVKK